MVYLILSEEVSTPFTPANLTTSLWLDAGDSDSVILSGGVVSQWNDKSGNNNHATSPIGNRPAYSSGAIVFDGVNDYLITGANSTLNTDTISWFTVFDYDGTASETRTLFRTSYSSGASAGSPYMFGLYNENSNLLSTTRSSSGVLVSNTLSTILLPIIISTTWDASNNISTWSNGSFTASASEGTATPTGHITTYIGTTNIPPISFFWKGKLQELIILPSALDTNTREKVEGYLAHKWNLTGKLPVNHPYKNSAPTI